MFSLFFTLAFLGLSKSHIFMSNPPSRMNKYSQYYSSNNLVDYNLMAPLLYDGHTYTFPCKGYSKGPVTKIITDNKIVVSLEGSATHSGGHCQFGVSFDDITFVVLYKKLDNCLLDSMTYTIDLPKHLSGNMTFFWTWINRTGNREYYMECADIHVTKTTEECFVRGNELVVANYPGYPILPEGLSDGAGIDLINNAKSIFLNCSSVPLVPPVPKCKNIF